MILVLVLDQWNWTELIKMSGVSSFTLFHTPDIDLGCEIWHNNSCSNTCINIPDYILFCKACSQDRDGETCICLSPSLSTTNTSFDNITQEVNFRISASLTHNNWLLYSRLKSCWQCKLWQDFGFWSEHVNKGVSSTFLGRLGSAIHDNLFAFIDIYGSRQHFNCLAWDNNTLDIFSVKAALPASQVSFLLWPHLTMSMQKQIICSSYLILNRCAWPTISINSIDWCDLFLINGAAFCSQLFVEHFYRMLSSQVPTSFKKQHFKVVFLHPSVRKKLRHLH